MGRIKKWRNVPGSISIECGVHETVLHPLGVWATEQRKWQRESENYAVTLKPIPDVVAQELKSLFPADNYSEYDFELEVAFRSSGYYDPGVLSGPPERCYPPEGEDERLIDGEVIVSFVDADKTKKLSKKASEELFEAFIDEIQEAELDRDWDESPD